MESVEQATSNVNLADLADGDWDSHAILDDMKGRKMSAWLTFPGREGYH